MEIGRRGGGDWEWGGEVMEIGNRVKSEVVLLSLLVVLLEGGEVD